MKMEIMLHNGKTKKVSLKRWDELKNHPYNNEIWLAFRMKVFEGFSKEELILHPYNYILVPCKKRSGFCVVKFLDENKFKTGSSYDEGIKERFFSTPEEAYEYANKF